MSDTSTTCGYTRGDCPAAPSTTPVGYGDPCLYPKSTCALRQHPAPSDEVEEATCGFCGARGVDSNRYCSSCGKMQPPPDDGTDYGALKREIDDLVAQEKAIREAATLKPSVSEAVEEVAQRLAASLANSAYNTTTHDQQEEWLADLATLRAHITAQDAEIERLRMLAHDYDREEGTHWCAVAAKYRKQAERDAAAVEAAKALDHAVGQYTGLLHRAVRMMNDDSDRAVAIQGAALRSIEKMDALRLPFRAALSTREEAAK